MTGHRTTARRVSAAAAAVGATLLVAACGSSGSTTHASNASAATGKSAAKTTRLTIGTAKGSMGTYLTGASGRAVYMWVADKHGKSACAGTCAQNWPPLTTSSKPAVLGGVNAADLGTTIRSGGVKQVTYKGHPLYYYIGDSGPDMTNGQGSDGFGAKWWLLAPTGTPISGNGGSATAASNSSSGGSSNSSSSGGSSSSSGGSSSSWG